MKQEWDNDALQLALFTAFFSFFNIFFSFFSSSEGFSCVYEAHLESFVSNQLLLKCESTVTFSLINSLQVTSFPSYSLCKSQPYNQTDLNQTSLITPAAF